MSKMNSIYDRALSEVGTGGCFQKKVNFIVNIAVAALWSVCYIHMFVVLVVVPHTCKLPEKTQNVSDEAWKLKYIPHENKLNGLKFDNCLIYSSPDDNNLTRSCTEYEYDKTWYESTVSTENDWVCDKEIFIPNILAYSKIMELIGSVVFGLMGDAYGRRSTYVVTLVLTVIGRVISLLAGRSYSVFLLGCLIASFGLWSVMQSASVICIEITSPKRRSLITFIRCTSGCIAVSVMPFIYWWLGDWKTFIIITTLPLIMLIFFSWHMIESPRWHFTKGETKKCLIQLKRIAEANGRCLSVETEKELLSHKPQCGNESLGPFALFSKRKLATNTLLHIMLWIAGSACFAMQVLSIGQNPDGNPYLELVWQTLSEFPANFIGAWLADRIGRRYTGALSYGVTSAIWLLIAIRETALYSWARIWWIGTILNLIIRLSNAVSYYVASLLAMELYPTCLRQSGLALGNVAGSIGSVLAPYILFLGRRIDERLPGLLISGLAVCAVLSSLFLPETLNAKLPETIEEAESIGRNKPTYSSVRLKRLSLEKVQVTVNESIA